jgi:Heavy-metal resistance
MSGESRFAWFQRWLPQLRSRWWTPVLGLSLMLNLLVGGVIIGHVLRPDGPDRMTGASYVQLIPRAFLRELDGKRRREILEIIRDYRPDLRALRQASDETAMALATVVDHEAYDPAAVKAVVDGFALKSGALASKGGDVVLQIIAMLTPEERKALAVAIRQRDGKKGK